MNEEQTKRLADAAEAIVQAADALDEAREASADKRFESELERDRTSAGQQLGSKVDAAAKRIEDAIRKSTIAGALASRPGAFRLSREALAAAREGRALGRTISDQDGTPGKRARADEAIAKLDAALTSGSQLVFVE